MDFRPLPDDLLERIIQGINSFLENQEYLSESAKVTSLCRALSRANFYPEDLLKQMEERRGNKPRISYLRSHEPFERAFGPYLGR